MMLNTIVQINLGNALVPLALIALMCGVLFVFYYFVKLILNSIKDTDQSYDDELDDDVRIDINEQSLKIFKGPFRLIHNSHIEYEQTLEEYASSIRGFTDHWLSEDEKKLAFERNELWTLIWGTTGFTKKLYAASFESLIEHLQSKQV